MRSTFLAWPLKLEFSMRNMALSTLVLVLLAASLAAACQSGSEAEDVDDADAGDASLSRGDSANEHHDDEEEDADVLTGPQLLSETGLYSNIATREIASDLFAFAPRYSFWSDGGEKARWLYLPPGTQ